MTMGVTNVDHKESMGRYFCSSNLIQRQMRAWSKVAERAYRVDTGWTFLAQNDPLRVHPTGDALT